MTGVPVVLPAVMAESRNVLELAPTLPRPTVDWSVRELGRRQKHAKLENL